MQSLTRRACVGVQRLQSQRSRIVQWDGRRLSSNFNPLQWIQQKFAPSVRKSTAPDAPKQETADLVPAQQEAFTEAKLIEGSTKHQKKKKVAEAAPEVVEKQSAPEHKYSTANFKISHRKLNMLGRQISGKPIDHAIMQMQFSEKRASNRIMSMLATAKLHATVYKNMDPSKLVVSEAWVTKGENRLKRLEPRGRGKFGIRVHPDSRLHVILRPGKTYDQVVKEQRERRLKRIVSAGLVREDVPLRNPASFWQW
ncbi:ribosomal protein L22/L17 [Pisolithus orientalis]|nr:ribosomal protein L22/L17 [Pisolithus orientalis]KAI6035370.1 ribosomal protein L22/L17 [Pisolithus orientalis]